MSIVSAIGKVAKYSPKVPRFIYHMTSKKNYDAIMKSGVLKMSEDLMTDGVFAMELPNFFKRWNGIAPLPQGGQNELVEWASKGADDFVILRIPTGKLNPDKLKVRSFSNVISWLKDSYGDFHTKAENIWMSELKNYVNNGSIGKAPEYRDVVKNLIKNTESKDNVNMLLAKVPANKARHYKQHKHAIEYVYKDNIPADTFEKIGEVNLPELKASAEYDPSKPVRSTFLALLKGTPEVKGAELLNC